MQMRRFWGIYESGRRVIRDRFAALAALALLLFALPIGPGLIVQAQQEVSSYGLVQVLSGVVEHNGPGIAADQRADAVKPFARLDAARNQDKGAGVGLGLAIAADIARSHGGSLILSESDDLGGLKAAFRLPR